MDHAIIRPSQSLVKGGGPAAQFRLSDGATFHYFSNSAFERRVEVVTVAEDAIGQRGNADLFAPARDRQLRGQNRRPGRQALRVRRTEKPQLDPAMCASRYTLLRTGTQYRLGHS